MKPITVDIQPVGSVSEEDAERFAAYCYFMLSLNMFDKDVLTYPRTVIVSAKKNDEPLLYMPLQSVLMYDSLCPKPGITPREEAVCLKKIVDAVDDAARDSGHRETYFFCKDDRVADIAARHGFEEIKGVRLLKRKVKPIETEG